MAYGTTMLETTLMEDHQSWHSAWVMHPSALVQRSSHLAPSSSQGLYEDVIPEIASSIVETCNFGPWARIRSTLNHLQ